MIPDIELAYTLNDTPATVRFRSLPLQVWSDLKRQQGGFTPRTLCQAIENVDPEGFAAVLWLQRTAAGERVSVAQVFDGLTPDDELVITRLRIRDRWLVGEPTEDADEPDPTTAS